MSDRGRQDEGGTGTAGAPGQTMNLVVRQLVEVTAAAAWTYEIGSDEFTFYMPSTADAGWQEAELERALREPERVLNAESAASWRHAFAAAVRDGSSWDMVVTYPDGAARRRWVRSMGRAELRHGRPVRVYGVAHDITSTRTMQEQFLQAQKMEGLGLLAGGIAHDFNNILTAISAYLTFVSESLPEAHTAQEDLAGMAHAVRAGTDLVRQLLSLSRQQETQPVALDIGKVLRELHSLLRRTLGARVRIEMQIADPLQPVLADRSQIEQVIVNLAVNARDAMPEGGTLTFTLRVAAGAALACTMTGVRPPGTYIELVVRDTGCGIDPDTRAHIFQPFFTTKERGRGTGLGLPTCLGIVQRAGGFIDVESAPGEGTAFHIWLPVMPRAAE